MRERLQALNALNRADSVLTARERDEALSLVDFFDRHGTANEQMLAHYLLGRCYADMHEAPRIMGTELSPSVLEINWRAVP